MSNNIHQLFSEPRLKPYRKTNQDSIDEVMNRYHWNIKLSEAFYPGLHYLEVILRNRIDAIIQYYIDPDWLLNRPQSLLFSSENMIKIRRTENSLGRKRHKPTSHSDLVAQMNFGFWYAFFHKQYDPILWHRKDALKSIFPNLPRKQRTRPQIEPQLMRIKSIRNRIAHYEPIWNQGDLYSDYQLLIQLIRAMSPEATKRLKRIDRFNQVYQRAQASGLWA